MDIVPILISAVLLFFVLRMLRILDFFKTVAQHYLIDNPDLFHWKKITEEELPPMEVRHVEQSPFYGPTAIHLQKVYKSNDSSAAATLFFRVKSTDIVIYTRKEVPVISDTSSKVIIATYTKYHRMGKTMLWMKEWHEFKGEYKVVDNERNVQ
jgi:hypothetical protein